jgi:hypothetical protein
MRTLRKTSVPTLVVALVAMAIVGCEKPGPTQPAAGRTGMSAARADEATSNKPEIDPTYANGKTVYMIGPHMIVGARETQPNLYEHAEELYLVVYPQASFPLASGYEPQCNPCFHPGLPAQFVFHDHIIAGAPGMGNNGTAGAMKGPWKVILVMYNPAYIASPFFTPIKSQKDLDDAEKAGKAFLPFNQGADNPYEAETGNVLICPIVSSHA